MMTLEFTSSLLSNTNSQRKGNEHASPRPDTRGHLAPLDKEKFMVKLAVNKSHALA